MSKNFAEGYLEYPPFVCVVFYRFFSIGNVFLG